MRILYKMRNLILVYMVLNIGFNAEAKNHYQYLYKDLPFSMPLVKVPVFKKNMVSVEEFGGVGDGITLNTNAFAKSMDALAAKGGGTLIVPKGIWFTGPIVFQIGRAHV